VLRLSEFVKSLLLSAFVISLSCVIGQDAFSQVLEAPSDVSSEEKRYAACVIDLNTDRVLFEQNGTAIRHPASLAKMMTLYLLFEELERSRLNLHTLLRVSSHAAAQPPSKLGLKENDTIKVRDAIRGIITRSANDVAVVIAEHISGKETSFAEKMTAKAKTLNMRDTFFYNASGLHHPSQVTTACDMAKLGVALKKRFSSYYRRFFSLRSFTYRGSVVSNTNKLLDKENGIDGIKTGYTRASGFNLASSVSRGNRGIIATVMGFASSASRDRHMRRLLTDYLEKASSITYEIKTKHEDMFHDSSIRWLKLPRRVTTITEKVKEKVLDLIEPTENSDAEHFLSKNYKTKPAKVDGSKSSRPKVKLLDDLGERVPRLKPILTRPGNAISRASKNPLKNPDDAPKPTVIWLGLKEK